MLTMIPAQWGVSLASREGLMVVMRKATTVMVMPSSSCSRAMSSGKRQPQHLWLPSSSGPPRSGLAFFCPPLDPTGLLSDPMLPPVFLTQAQWLSLPSNLEFSVSLPLSSLQPFSSFCLQFSFFSLFPDWPSVLFTTPLPCPTPPLPAGGSSPSQPARLQLFEIKEGSELIWKTF